MPPTSVKVGDTITWKGPRNYGFRAITGTVLHVGRLFLKVQMKGNQCTWVDRGAVTEVIPV